MISPTGATITAGTAGCGSLRIPRNNYKMSQFLHFPTVIYIEPTNDCNLSCIMCPRKKSSKAVGYMPFKLFRRVIDQLAGHDIAQLSLHLTGEPLLHPQIIDMVHYAKRSGMRHVRFATNATLLDDDLARGLIESGLDSLTVSMDTTTAAKYCPQREKLFEELDSKILRLIELRHQLGMETPKVDMQIIRMNSTERMIADFVSRWQGVADRVTVKPLLSWAGLINVPQKSPTRRLICMNHLTQGVVQWNGDVSSCCLYIDHQGDSAGIIDNLAHSSLEEIFLGAKRRAIIVAQLKGNYDVVPHCKRCPDWNDYLNGVKLKEKSEL